ncbi:hypothetical protein L210DRAFT_3314204, partial [Boletus edulis BED1]
LNDDQRRAYDIICWHLDQTLLGVPIPPLRMIIHGEGGTGKTAVLQCVSDYFKKRSASHRLIKTAYTGMAASLIGGQTCHSACLLTHRDSNISSVTKKKLEQIWSTVAYDITDEMSMISKRFFARMS